MKTLDILLTASGDSQMNVVELLNDYASFSYQRVSAGLYRFTCTGEFVQHTTSNYSVLTKIVDGGDNSVGIILSPEGNGDDVMLACYTNDLTPVDIECNGLRLTIVTY